MAQHIGNLFKVRSCREHSASQAVTEDMGASDTAFQSCMTGDFAHDSTKRIGGQWLADRGAMQYE